jgi:hypothetical protein
LGSSTVRVSLNTAGSFSRTHTSFGAVNPGIAMFPVMSRERGSVFSSVAHCCSLRPSFHRIAGRSGWSVASSNVAPCIWPDRPTAFTAARAFAGSALTAALVALHQSAGFCSDHPGCGRETFSAAEACSTTVSSSSTMTALTLEVPISMPRYIHPRCVAVCEG